MWFPLSIQRRGAGRNLSNYLNIRYMFRLRLIPSRRATRVAVCGFLFVCLFAGGFQKNISAGI